MQNVSNIDCRIAAIITALFMYSGAQSAERVIYYGLILTSDELVRDEQRARCIWGMVNGNSPERICSELNSEEFKKLLKRVGGVGAIGESEINLHLNDQNGGLPGEVRFTVDAANSEFPKFSNVVSKYIELRRSGFSCEMSFRILESLMNKNGGLAIKDKYEFAKLVFGDDVMVPFPELYSRAFPRLELESAEEVYYILDGEVARFLIFGDDGPFMLSVDASQVLDRNVWSRIIQVYPGFLDNPISFEDALKIRNFLTEKWGIRWVGPYVYTPMWLNELFSASTERK